MKYNFYLEKEWRIQNGFIRNKMLRMWRNIDMYKSNRKKDEGDIRLAFECSNPDCNACETWDIADYTE